MLLLELARIRNVFHDGRHELRDRHSEQMWCDMIKLYEMTWYKWSIIWICHDTKYATNAENDREVNMVDYRCEAVPK